MEIRLISIHIQNFKAVKNERFDFKGNSAVICGANGLGKTTIYDAFLWLLFDKNSEGKQGFSIKTLIDGKPVSKLEHAVEAVLSVNGKNVTLKRIYREKWTQKRSAKEALFDGHESIYEIDGVPKSSGEFQAYIGKLIPEEHFRLVTSPDYFNRVLKWQDRRKILVDLFGDISNADVIACSPTLAVLTDLLEDKSIEDLRRMYSATKGKINEELKALPGKINEANLAIPKDLGNKAELIKKEAAIRKQLADLGAEKTGVVQSVVIAEQRTVIAGLEGDLITLRNKHEQGAIDVSEERDLLGAESVGLCADSTELDKLNQELQQACTVERVALEANRNLQKRYLEITETAFLPASTCFACNQPLPEAAVASQQEAFNLQRAKDLDQLLAAGNENNAKITAARADITALGEKIKALDTRIKARGAKIESLKAKMEKKISSRPAVEDLPEYREIAAQLQTAKEVLEKAEKTSWKGTVDKRVEEAENQLRDVMASLAACEVASTQIARIGELQAREKELAGEFERTQQVIEAIEEFERTQAGMLDARVSEAFELVRFKLTDLQINGGSSPTCVCTLDGVPFPDLNTAGGVKAGLDIIRTVSKARGIIAPIFIDRRESITEIPDMPGQIISLVVSPEDKIFRIKEVQHA